MIFCFVFIYELNSNEKFLLLISLQNLAESIANVGLHDLFQKYGNILSSKTVMSEDGKSKGYGYIQFDSEESANDAIQKMNGSTVRDKQMYVKLF
jgi:polyadenylate-binding protein